MSLAIDLTRMAWRRLAKVGPLTEPMAKVKDRVETLRFQLDGKQRAELAQGYASCRTVKDYFEFANRSFGAHQLEPEITGFLQLAAGLNPRAVCEIGTANGGTTFLLGQSLLTTELMIGVDLYVKRRPRLGHLSRPGQRVVLIDGDSGAPSTLEFVKRELADRQLDILFIDGDHTLAGVARDFETYRHLVREGGLIAFHDIMEDSFTRTGVRTDHWTGGVPQFWRTIKTHFRSQEFVVSPTQDGLGIGVIWYEGPGRSSAVFAGGVPLPDHR